MANQRNQGQGRSGGKNQGRPGKSSEHDQAAREGQSVRKGQSGQAPQNRKSKPSRLGELGRRELESGGELNENFEGLDGTV
jgi:hypothetical protein